MLPAPVFCKGIGQGGDGPGSRQPRRTSGPPATKLGSGTLDGRPASFRLSDERGRDGGIDDVANGRLGQPRALSIDDLSAKHPPRSRAGGTPAVRPRTAWPAPPGPVTPSGRGRAASP